MGHLTSDVKNKELPPTLFLCLSRHQVRGHSHRWNLTKIHKNCNAMNFALEPNNFLKITVPTPAKASCLQIIYFNL